MITWDRLNDAIIGTGGRCGMEEVFVYSYDKILDILMIEDGMTENESVTRSLRSCIEAAVLELIYQGEKKEFWKINWPTEEILEAEIKENEYENVK